MSFQPRRRFVGFFSTTLLASSSLVLGAGCSGTAADDEATGSTTEAVTGAPSPFYYLRSNSTDWNVDEGSRLLPTQDPNVFSRTVDYTLNYDDSAIVTEAVANGPDQWGNQQIYFSTSKQGTFVVPGTQTLVSGSSPPNFQVHYPHTGQYIASFNASLHTLTIGVATLDGGTDAGHDAGADTGTDAGRDSGADAEAGLDATADGDADAHADATTDADADAEAGLDATVDADADAEAGLDATADAEAGQDATAEAGQEGGADTGVESGVDGGAGGSWQRLANLPSFSTDTSLLLTDGRVAVHSASSSIWWSLTPDVNGSYLNGTWKELASLPVGYGPLYFASAVLPDGRLIVEGGEYNLGLQVWTNLGAIYDPLADVWTSVAPPAGWSNIGDAEGVVLANGTFMLANSLTSQQALLDASKLTWTPTGSGKADGNDEEGWNLLPSGKVVTVDAVDVLGSELYDPTTGSWTSAGSTVVSLVDVASEEIGPAVLQPSGNLFATGGSGHTAQYSPVAGTWSAGPDFPAVAGGQLDVADGPAACLPNGRVLVAASPGVFLSDTHYFEFDGAALHEVARPPNASSLSSFQARLLVLPTGQILEVDGSTDVEVYTPTGAPSAAWEPTITNVASTITRGSTFVVRGTQFNGLSQGAAYGDDAQEATNYPLVRITNTGTGHVFYARTHGHSTMAVATGSAIVSTSFDVPAGAEVGASQLAVVANGIASSPVAVTVQ
jgi:hypothetical protein